MISDGQRCETRKPAITNPRHHQSGYFYSPAKTEGKKNCRNVLQAEKRGDGEVLFARTEEGIVMWRGAFMAEVLARLRLRPGEMRWSTKQMTNYPYRTTGLIVEALVPRACGKSTGGWHNRLYNITRNL
jgi:hypothetical protein